jgi:hypothetical protein
MHPSSEVLKKIVGRSRRLGKSAPMPFADHFSEVAEGGLKHPPRRRCRQAASGSIPNRSFSLGVLFLRDFDFGIADGLLHRRRQLPSNGPPCDVDRQRSAFSHGPPGLSCGRLVQRMLGGSGATHCCVQAKKSCRVAAQDVGLLLGSQKLGGEDGIDAFPRIIRCLRPSRRREV